MTHPSSPLVPLHIMFYYCCQVQRAEIQDPQLLIKPVRKRRPAKKTWEEGHGSTLFTHDPWAELEKFPELPMSTPKSSSTLMGFSSVNHPAMEVPPFMFTNRKVDQPKPQMVTSGVTTDPIEEVAGHATDSIGCSKCLKFWTKENLQETIRFTFFLTTNCRRGFLQMFPNISDNS